jgi:hypothetical protein
MIGSAPPDESTNADGTSADSAPAATEVPATEVPAPAAGADEDTTAAGQAAPVTAPDPSPGAGWLVLLVAGVVLMLARPVARRLAQ